MAISTINTLMEAFKTHYREPISIQLNEQVSPVWAAIEKRNENVVGNEFEITLEYGRSGGVGSRAEDGNLPTPSTRLYKKGKAQTKNIFARISLTHKLLLSSMNRDMTFVVNELDRQTNNVMTDAKDYISRNMMTDHSGKFGVVSAYVAGPPRVITLSPTASIIEAFYPGQVIDIITSAGVAKVSGISIIDVDYDAGKITLDTSTTIGTAPVATDIITIAGSYNTDLTGLMEILTKDTTIYDIDRASNKYFNPNVQDKYDTGAPTPIDSMWIETAMNSIAKRQGKKPDFIVCNYGVQNAYVEEQRQYSRNIEMEKVDGGFELVAYRRTPISPEKYFPAESLAVLTMEDFFLGRVSDWTWIDNDGAILNRLSDKAAFDATLALYAELVCTRPAAQSFIKGIQEVN
jgi:hypothetical protein